MRGRGALAPITSQIKKEKEINEIKSKAGEPRAAFDWFIWFH